MGRQQCYAADSRIAYTFHCVPAGRSRVRKGIESIHCPVNTVTLRRCHSLLYVSDTLPAAASIRVRGVCTDQGSVSSLSRKPFHWLVDYYKETQWLGVYRQETRAGNYQRHTRTRNVSLPTQANHTARGARKQPPNQGAIHAASQDTTHTSNYTACHKCRPARHPPRAQQVPCQRTHNYKRGAGATVRRLKTLLDTEELAREVWPGLNTEYRFVDAKART